MSAHLYVGTSGYSYKEWKGTFYPCDLAASRMLSYYGGRFRAVEINNTFYRNPNPDVLRRWVEEVPEDFVFVLKGAQYVTHRARLKDAEKSVQRFFEAAAALGKKRGPVFYQLPPYFKCDVDLLEQFLGGLPPNERVAMEFRHTSWFDEQVYAVLRKHGAALCVADTDESDAPKIATADWGYVRLRRAHYTLQDLQRWRTWVDAQSFGTAYVFFKHEEGGKGPDFAQQFLTKTK